MRKKRPLVYSNENTLRDGLFRLGFKCKRIEDPHHCFTHMSALPVHIDKLVFVEPNFDLEFLPSRPYQINVTAVVTMRDTGYQIKLYGGSCARIECITLYDTLVECGKKKKKIPGPDPVLQSTMNIPDDFFNNGMHLYNIIRRKPDPQTVTLEPVTLAQQITENNRCYSEEAFRDAVNRFVEKIDDYEPIPCHYYLPNTTDMQQLGTIVSVEELQDGVFIGKVKLPLDCDISRMLKCDTEGSEPSFSLKSLLNHKKP